MGERRVRLSVDEGGAGGTGRLGRRGPRETRSRETWEPMSSNEAVLRRTAVATGTTDGGAWASFLAVADGQRPVLVRFGAFIHRDELLARHLGHGCEHPFIRDIARLQLLLDHSLPLGREIGRRGRSLPASRCCQRGDKQPL